MRKITMDCLQFTNKHVQNKQTNIYSQTVCHSLNIFTRTWTSSKGSVEKVTLILPLFSDCPIPHVFGTRLLQRLWTLIPQSPHCTPCLMSPYRRLPQWSHQVGVWYVVTLNLWGRGSYRGELMLLVLAFLTSGFWTRNCSESEQSHLKYFLPRQLHLYLISSTGMCVYPGTTLSHTHMHNRTSLGG